MSGRYELTNHPDPDSVSAYGTGPGNVAATISDRKQPVDIDSVGIADYYEPVVLSAADYYPFGMEMPGRVYQAGDYRFGFNGKEKDQNQEWGDLTHYDYGFRIYNPGIGRFLSVDPLTRSYPWYSPYQFAGNKPTVAIDLDGLEEVIIHSAFWTEKFLELDLNTMTYDEIAREVNRINEKGYSDAASRLYAERYYESKGDVATIKPAPNGVLNLTGFTNAATGEAIKFKIYSSVEGGGYIEILHPGIEVPKEGLENRVEGLEYAIGTFIAKYSGFGKLGRALHNYMDEKDPWTGKKESTSRLVIGGVTDLATMGYGGPTSATWNVTLNAAQEILEHLKPEQLEKIGLGREVIDLGFSIKEPNKLLKTVEVISNLIQAGYLTHDAIEKHQKKAKDNSN